MIFFNICKKVLNPLTAKTEYCFETAYDCIWITFSDILTSHWTIRNLIWFLLIISKKKKKWRKYLSGFSLVVRGLNAASFEICLPGLQNFLRCTTIYFYICSVCFTFPVFRGQILSSNSWKKSHLMSKSTLSHHNYCQLIFGGTTKVDSYYIWIYMLHNWKIGIKQPYRW